MSARSVSVPSIAAHSLPAHSLPAHSPSTRRLRRSGSCLAAIGLALALGPLAAGCGKSSSSSASSASSSSSSPPPEAQPVAAAPGSGGLRSAGALEFGDGGVLFVGDSYGSKIVALETKDTGPPRDPTSAVYVEKIDVELASLLGAAPRDIVINDLAVNPDSKNVYLSVHVGRSVNPRVAIVRYNRHGGKLEALDLDAMPHTQVELPGPPAFEDTLQYGQSIRTLTITDLTWYKGELFVAGISNQDFDSTLRRLAYPFTGKQSRVTVEIYHTSHDEQETHAPIVTSIVYEIAGEPYLIAAYTCTPLARFRLSDLKDKAHVVGDTIAELGNGNGPVDMLVYTASPRQGGGDRILITNDQRGAVSVSAALVATAEPIKQKSPAGTGLDQTQLPVTGALHAASLDRAHTVVVRRNVQSGNLSLMTLDDNLFFEVAESVGEYNFPNVPDAKVGSTNGITYGFDKQP